MRGVVCVGGVVCEGSCVCVRAVSAYDVKGK